MDFRSSELPVVSRWDACWINLPMQELSGPRYRCYRKTFFLKKQDGKVFLHITAENSYDLFLNGRRIARGPAAAPPEFKRYDSFRVDPFLADGNNTIAVCVFSGKSNDAGYKVPDPALGALLCRIEDGNGRSICVSDETWKAAIHTGFLNINEPFCATVYGEFFDTGAFPGSWQMPEFDDTLWQPVSRVVNPRHPLWGAEQTGARFYPWVCLQPSEIAALQEKVIFPQGSRRFSCRRHSDPIPGEAFLRLSQETLLAADLTLSKQDEYSSSHPRQSFDTFDGIFDPVLILDFGRIVNARLQLDFECAADFTLDISYGLEPDDSGRINPFSSRYIRSADCVVFKKGRGFFENFNWRCFRFVQLTFRTGEMPVRIKKLQAEETFAAFDDSGCFDASAPVLNRIFDGVKKTLKLCCMDQIMDNPTRERRQYLGDCAAAVPSLLAIHGNNALSEKYFRQFDQSIHNSGLYRYSTWHENDAASLFDHSLILPGRLLDHFRFTGNSALIREMAPGLCRFSRLIRSCIGSGGLIHEVPYSCWFDWADVGRKDCSFLLNAYALYALQSLAELLPEEAAETAGPAAQLRKQLHDQFFDVENGLFADTLLPDGKLEHFSEHSNLLALALDIADPDQTRRIAENLEQHPEKTAYSSPCWQFASEGFLAAGLPDLFFRWLEKRSHLLDRRNIDTVPETWFRYCENTLGIWRARSSRASVQASGIIIHGWTFLTGVCGIFPLTPGFGSVRFAPQPGSLQHLSGTLPAPDGKHSMTAEQSGKHLTFTLSLPREKEVLFVFPAEKCIVNGVEMHCSGKEKTGNRFFLTPEKHFNIIVDLEK